MGALANALRNATFDPVEAPVDVNQGALSEFGKGLNSSLTGMGAGLRAVAGTVGEAMGFDEFAQGQYDAARAAELRAQSEAPRVSSYKDVGGLRDMVHYGAGVLGGSAPSMALGLGAGMTARTGAQALLRGTLAQTPIEAGDVALKQRHDPEALEQSAGERLLRQGVGGAASATLQTIIPAHIGGKVMGRGVDDAAKLTLKQAALRNAGSIPAEGFFEGGGEVVKQIASNDQRELDWENVKENVVGGMVGGAPMAAVGTVADAAHGAPGKALSGAASGVKSIRDRLSAGKDAVVEKTPVKVKSALDDIADFTSGKFQRVRDTIERVAKGGTVADPAEFAGLDETQMGAKLDEDDKARTKATTSWGEELLNKTGLTPEVRAKVAEAMKNPEHPAAAATVAAAKAAADKAKVVVEAVDRAMRGVKTGSSEGVVVEGETRVVPDFDPAKALGTEPITKAKEGDDADFTSRVRGWADEIRDPVTKASAESDEDRESFLKQRVDQGATPIQALKEWKAMSSGKKLSDDPTGFQYQTAVRMLDELGIRESHPEIFDDHEATLSTLSLLGHLTAQMEKGTKVDGSMLMETVGIFGPRAADIVNRMYAKVGSAKPEVRENVYKAIIEMAAVADHHQRLLEFMAKSLTPEMQATTKVTDLPTVLRRMIAAEQGRHGFLSAAEQQFKNMGVVRDYASAFGEKGMDIRNAVRAYVDSTRAPIKYGVDKTVEKSILEDEEVQDNQGVGRVFDADGDEIGEHQTVREVMRYGGPIRKTKDGQMMSEVGVAVLRDDADKFIAGVQKKYGERYSVEFEPLDESSEYGHVVVREQAGKDDFTDSELEKMKLDTGKYSKSPSRLEMTVDGKKLILDAVKIARHTLNKGNDMTSGGGESTYLQRMADSFRRGMASLIGQSGTENLQLPDSLVVEYRTGPDGKSANVTWGQIKNLHASDIGSLEESFSPQGRAKLEALRAAYREAGTPAARGVVLGEVELLAQREKDRELSRGELQTHEDGEALNKKSGLAWRLAKQRKTPHYQDQETGNMVREHRNSIFDDEGNLTKAGAEQLVVGDYDSGIGVSSKSTNIGGTEGLTNRADYFADARNAPNYEGEGDTKVRAKPNRRDFDGGQGRREIGNDENIHLTTALEGSEPGRGRSNMDGSGYAANGRDEVIVGTAQAVSNLSKMAAQDGIAKRIGERGLVLARNRQMMSTADQRRFAELAGNVKLDDIDKRRDGSAMQEGTTISVSGAAPIVNELAAKYSNRLTFQGDAKTRRAPDKMKDIELSKAYAEVREAFRREQAKPADMQMRLTEFDKQIIREFKGRGLDPVAADAYAPKAGRIVGDSGRKLTDGNKVAQYERQGKAAPRNDNAAYDDWLWKNARAALDKDIAEHNAKLGEGEGGTPDPKAVAAKKAAFLKKAASGDKDLIAELRSSSDAKGLQRAAELLNEHEFVGVGEASKTAENVMDVLDAVNERLAELVQDEGTAYGLQTKMYSLVSDTVHFALERAGFAAAHDSPIRHEGKFDWRKWSGKGEGVAAFGAGTYLSTADGVHKSYKRSFTARLIEDSNAASAADELKELARKSDPMRWVASRSGKLWLSPDLSLRITHDGREFVVYDTEYGAELAGGYSSLEAAVASTVSKKDKAREAELRAQIDAIKSPTYHVSVDIKPEQLLDWDKPLSEQSELVQKALRDLVPVDIDKFYVDEAAEKYFDAFEKELGDKAGYTHGQKLLEQASLTNTAHALEVWRRQTGEYADTYHKAADLFEKFVSDLPRQDVDGDEIYRSLTIQHEVHEVNGVKGKTAQAAASDYLQSLGILGHVYNASGGKDDARRNYVIYDDSKITTNYVQFSQTGTSPSSDARAFEAEIKAYIEKVLGKSVKRAWAKFTHAGEFERMKLHDIIRISIHALDPLSTAYHESLHAFFAQLRDAGATDVIDVLQKAAKQEHVVKQLEEIYKNQPRVLAQLKNPEERVAYMYQHWVADPKGFKVSIGARTVMERVKAFIRNVLGIWSNDQRALHIMEYFNSGEYAKNLGKPNAVHRALMEPGTNKVVEALKPLTSALDHLAEATFASGDARLRDIGIEAIDEIADVVKLDHRDASGRDRGFLPAARAEATKRLAKLGDLLAKYSSEQQRETLEHLQRQTVPTDAKVFDLVGEIKQTLKETRQYMVDAGMKVGNLGPDYFPRVWDVHYMATHEAEVRTMLEKYVQSGQYKGNVSDLLRDLMARDGTEYMGETPTPGMQHAKRRKLDFISPEDAAPFLRKDLAETLVSYVTQASRRAEWQRRLGANVSEDPGEYESWLSRKRSEARQQGATDADLRTVDLYLKSVDGTLGDTMDPGLRRLMGNMIVYQNIRLLPMAAFSMAVDPLGVLVRGGTLNDTYKAAKRGLKSILETLGKAGKRDEIEELAEMMGVVDAATLSHVMSDIYTQGMVGGKMRKANDLFFKYNFVEGINRSMRVGATEAAMRFLRKHADGKADPHSKRWMAELGVQDGDIQWLAADKRIALTVEDGLTSEQERRVQAAVNQWVDGAVLRPDATDKPIWMNDPHWALISHLKQFVFTFQHVILGRVVHEFKNGNFAPAMALSMYVPTMILADTLKGLIQGGGDVPEWKRGWGPAEYVGYGMQRAGLFGVGQFGIDVLSDLREGGSGIGALAGPTVEQFGDAVQLLGGRKQFGPMVLDALPANALYKHWFDSAATTSEPMFSA